jgi:hypothetical protein
MRSILNKVTTKLNNNVRKALAEASVQAKKHTSFDHFSYNVVWSNFPNSLLITCHMKDDPLGKVTNEASLLYLESVQEALSKLVQLKLLKQGIKFRDFRKNFQIITATQAPYQASV